VCGVSSAAIAIALSLVTAACTAHGSSCIRADRPLSQAAPRRPPFAPGGQGPVAASGLRSRLKCVVGAEPAPPATSTSASAASAVQSPSIRAETSSEGASVSTREGPARTPGPCVPTASFAFAFYIHIYLFICTTHHHVATDHVAPRTTYLMHCSA
jgi:hypothetical protein